MKKIIPSLLAASFIFGLHPAVALQYGDFTYTDSGGTATIIKYTGAGGTVVVPSKINSLPVTCITNKAFYNCSGILDITIPNSITNIGEEVFVGCTGLKNISIPDSVISLGEASFVVYSGGPFDFCTGLTNVTLPARFLGDIVAYGLSSSVASSTLINGLASALSTNQSLKNGISSSGATGPQGPAGPQGLAGPQGPQGPAGVFNPTVLTNTAFLQSLAANPTFLTALSTQIQLGSNNYGFAVKQNQSLNFPAIPPQTITLGKKYTNNVTSSSGLSVSQTSGNTAVATVLGNVLTLIGTGSTVITASQAGNALYNPVSTTQTLVVNKGIQTLNFPAIPAQTYVAGKTYAMSVTSSAGLTPVTYTSANTAVAIVSNNILLFQGNGTSLITASQAGNAYFNPSIGSQTLTVK